MDDATIRLIKRTMTLLDAAMETPVPTYKKRNKVYLEENTMKVGNALFEAHRTLTAILEDHGIDDKITPKVDSISAICSIEGDHDPHTLGGPADKYGIVYTYICPGRSEDSRSRCGDPSIHGPHALTNFVCPGNYPGRKDGVLWLRCFEKAKHAGHRYLLPAGKFTYAYCDGAERD